MPSSIMSAGSGCPPPSLSIPPQSMGVLGMPLGAGGIPVGPQSMMSSQGPGPPVMHCPSVGPQLSEREMILGPGMPGAPSMHPHITQHSIPPHLAMNHFPPHGHPQHHPMNMPPGPMHRMGPYMGQPEYKIVELNKRLSQRTEDCDNVWWDQFATEFFEDDASLTLNFLMDDGPKRYTVGRTLIPRYFRSLFESGCADLHYNLRSPRESFHNTSLTLDTEACQMSMTMIRPFPTTIIIEGRLVLEFTFDDCMRIRNWTFQIRNHREMIMRSMINPNMRDPMYFEHLSKNITRSGMTNNTLNFFRMCVILEPMQELMSRQKAYSLTPKDCLKTTLFQKWQRMVAPPGQSAHKSETSRTTNKRRKRKGSAANSENTGGRNSKRKQSPMPSSAIATPGDVMIVGEPMLMGGDFGDEDERTITRMENNQYQTGNVPPSLSQPPQSMGTNVSAPGMVNNVPPQFATPQPPIGINSQSESGLLLMQNIKKDYAESPSTLVPMGPPLCDNKNKTIRQSPIPMCETEGISSTTADRKKNGQKHPPTRPMSQDGNVEGIIASQSSNDPNAPKLDSISCFQSHIRNDRPFSSPAQVKLGPTTDDKVSIEQPRALSEPLPIASNALKPSNNSYSSDDIHDFDAISNLAGTVGQEDIAGNRGLYTDQQQQISDVLPPESSSDGSLKADQPDEPDLVSDLAVNSAVDSVCNVALQ